MIGKTGFNYYNSADTYRRPAYAGKEAEIPAAEKATGEEKPEVVNYKDSGEATAVILNDFSGKHGVLPEIIAFGETHCYTRGKQKKFTTTPEYFAKEIMPVLAQNGYKNIVLEFMPVEGSTDEEKITYGMVQREIADLNLDKELDFHSVEFVSNYPVLCCILDKTMDPKGELKILYAAKRLGIKIYSGGLTDYQYYQAASMFDINDPDYKYRVVFVAAKKVNDNSYGAIKKVLANREKVLYYGGAHHNNIDGEGLELSFGDDLTAEYGKKAYLDIDLLVPGVILDLKIENYYKYLKFAPATGAARYTQSGKESIIFSN